MAQKANIKDICALIDLKANATDVFKVFDGSYGAHVG